MVYWGWGPGGMGFFFFSSRRRHTRSKRDWSSDVCSSDLNVERVLIAQHNDAIGLELAAFDEFSGGHIAAVIPNEFHWWQIFAGREFIRDNRLDRKSVV